MTVFEPGTALEFFAGIGLARMGLERAGWRVVFANDNDPKKQEMHRGHWGDDPNYHLGDVFDLLPESVPAAELAWASFPCVDLSLAGNRGGLAGADSGAYWGFYRILDALGNRRPPLVVLENVLGMLTSHGGADLTVLVEGLGELGYGCDLLAVDAAWFVPQSRPRLFVVAARTPYALAPPSGTPSILRPPAVQRFIDVHSQLNWGDCPVPLQVPVAPQSLDDLLERFPDEADIWWTEAATSKLLSQMSERHLARVVDLAAKQSTSFATVYKRVRATGCMAEVRSDGIAGCLRTPRGGSSRQFVLEIGFRRIRARHMTAVEYGRLQGAGDFRIQVPFNQALFGFGDAVCVPVVEWLIRTCVNEVRAPSMELTHA